MTHWVQNSIFYHIYPLGFCGAPAQNDFSAAPVERLNKISGWLDHIQNLGVNALYLGPVFEASRHGYDTVDYYAIDRRLGTQDSLRRLVEDCHRRGIRVVLDGVFNHVGRDFWAFRDVQQYGASSAYARWFQNLRFGTPSPYGDAFSYEGWHGYFDLVKLDLSQEDVRLHLFDAVRMWVREFDIDGLRLDAADCVDLNFWHDFAALCHSLKPDFWLMGEVVHGDYKRWANPSHLDSVTNYEAYKGLYSSLNDVNYFEIAYTLKREFGDAGLYRDLPLYNFVDNHDVDRVASQLKNKAHLYPLYILLMSMPGVPSIYYGSEWGLEGKRLPHSDEPVRPSLELETAAASSADPHLVETIRRLTYIRHNNKALKEGDYQTLLTRHQQFAFSRRFEDEISIVILNAANEAVSVEIPLPVQTGILKDSLNPADTFKFSGGKVTLPMNANWGRILRVESH